MEQPSRKDKSVRITATAYEILANHSIKTGRKLADLLTKAVLRCYGGGTEKA